MHHLKAKRYKDNQIMPYQYLDDHIALVEMSHGPMHVLNQVQRQQLFDALLAAEQNAQVQAVILSGKDGVFSIGGDLTEFAAGQAFAYPHLTQDLFYLIENYQKPVVACLQGFALGGGLELAMACHARVADAKCKIGLPETKLGLIPGGEGTQRLPRAVGLERGISMMLSAELSNAEAFKDTLLLQVVAEQNVLDEAIKLAEQLIQDSQSIVRLSQVKLDQLSAVPLLEFAKLQLRAYPHNNPALEKVLDAVAVGIHKGFAQGCTQEAQLFAQVLYSKESEALRHIFLAEKSAHKLPKLAPDAPKIQRAAVIGAGFMGQGIAACLNSAGIETYIFDVNAEAAQQAVDKIVVSKGAKAEQIHVLNGLEDTSGMDLVIEAVSENLALKQSIFKSLGEHCPASVILASNTSSLDLNQIASVTAHPERVLGLHFFGPVQHMKLLEVIQGAQTADAVLAQAKHLAQRIRKIPVVSQVGPGFIGNRIFDAYLSQALALASTGVSPEQIDRAMRSWGMKMGPFQVMDLIGNDLLLSAWNGKFNGAGIHLLQQLVDAQRFGQKTQQGWYSYAGKNSHFNLDSLAELSNQAFKIKLPAEQIAQRLILSLYLEGLDVLNDGIASTKADIDLVFVHGYGFPAGRGGPMHYIEQHFSDALIQRQIRMLASDQADSFWQKHVKTQALEKIA